LKILEVSFLIDCPKTLKTAGTLNRFSSQTSIQMQTSVKKWAGWNKAGVEIL